MTAEKVTMKSDIDTKDVEISDLTAENSTLKSKLDTHNQDNERLVKNELYEHKKVDEE